METTKIETIIKSGISFEDYCIIKLSDKYNIFDYKDSINHLIAKVTQLRITGYLDMQEIPEITEKAKELLIKIEGGNVKESNKYDFEDIRKKLQESLLSTYGKKQVIGFGDTYFIPTTKELQEFLTRFWKKYPNFKDVVKIIKILKQHVEKCGKSRKFAPAVKYYIIKEGTGSQLANAYEDFEDNSVIIEKKEELTNTKDLF